MNASEIKSARERALGMLDKAGIILTPLERESIEITDLGLNDFDRQGLVIVLYTNNERYCGKELIMFPHQTCPEHRHPPVKLANGQTDPGKMETFRCRQGEVYLYTEGPPANSPRAKIPAGSESHYQVMHEIILRPGDQYTIPSNTKHWFQAGPIGAIVSEFSSTSRDESDFFTDPRIKRLPDAE